MSDTILVFNCGSSSLSYEVYGAQEDLPVIAWGKAYHVATHTQETAYIVHHWSGQAARQECDLPDHRSTAQAILKHLERVGVEPCLIGHRFVHGGAEFTRAVLVNEDTLPRLQALRPLAPIHNPNSLSVMELCREVRPQTRQYVAFDTAFHATIPEASSRYGLPYELADQLGLRKYGFHGLSYQYCALQTARYLQRPIEELKIVACHLGTGGSSVAAIRGGRSLDTTMGYSPLTGLLMSTRCGDLDPTIVIALIEEHGYSTDQVTRLLNKESGLIGVSGLSSDLLELIDLAKTQPRAALAVDMYIYRVRKYVGAHLALLDGADALVFTDDIGVRGWPVRAAVCQTLSFCGLRLDPTANRFASLDNIALLSAPESTITVLSIPTDEERMIAAQGMEFIHNG